MASTTDTRRIDLPYGTQFVPVDIPLRNLRSILSPNNVRAASDLDTEIRRALNAGEAVPNWMMRSEVQDIVRAELTMKHALFQE
jgi:hypothetical protein